MKTVEPDGRSITSPVYCNHRRGLNWAAIVTGKNAANAHRAFLKMRGRIVDLRDVMVGTVVEFAGDYVSARGNRQRDRAWYVIEQISDEEAIYAEFQSLAKAMKAAREKVQAGDNQA